MILIPFLREIEFPSQNIKDIFDVIPAALFVKDHESRIVLMNRVCEEHWGMSLADLQGSDGSGFFPPEQVEWFRAKDREVFAGGVQIDFEEAFWNAKLQENRIGHTFKKPIYDPQGKPAYLVGLTLDITERKRIEAGLNASNAQLRHLYELAPIGIVLTDMRGRHVEFNEAFERICGYSREELLALDDRTLTPPEYAHLEGERLASLAGKGCHGPCEKEYIRKDGTRVSLRLNSVLIHGSDGKPLVWSIVEDISERKQTEESMQLASLIYQSSSEAIMVTDERNRIVDVNAAFTRITGYTLADIKGKDPKVMQSGMHDREFYGQVWQSLLEEGCWQGEMWDRHRDGQLFAKWLNISVIRNRDGSVYRHVAQFSDITEKKQKDELIWHQANFDPLTDLPNRRLFRDRLEQEIKKAKRSGLPLALLFIDLDHFKEINDTLGHDQGDLLLAEAGKRIRRCVREADTLARLGGDEFTVIVPEFGIPASVERIAQNIIRELSVPFELGKDRGYISASVGITLYPHDAGDLENLLKHADRAMYLAKEQGRNRFAYFTESMQRRAEEKLALTNDLRHALERRELVVHYQPIVDAGSGRIVKAEALLRWRHPLRGLVSPLDFIPLAEESGLILGIGEWVFNQAVDTVRRWLDRFGRLIPISVNKSPVQFAEEVADNGWMERLAALDLPGHSITVEITEGVLIKDSPKVKNRLLEFRNRGVEVSIDDFGTGFSSLSYLKQFDVDFLKIDRSFVSNLAEDASDKALTEAIIVMAHKLGLQTIAEGVETEAQRDFLVSCGCDYAQGYLFSRPVPVEQFDALLAAELAAEKD